MIERYLVEVLPRSPTTPRGQPATYAFRGTCLRCGQNISMFELSLLAQHQCLQAVGIFALMHEHWREVVRDAFLAGRDAEAIQIICHELDLVAP